MKLFFLVFTCFFFSNRDSSGIIIILYCRYPTFSSRVYFTGESANLETMDIQQIQNTLQSLYGPTSPAEKKAASDALLQFQRSQQAWDVIFPILQEPNAPFELKLFVCQTLRSKVQYDFGQLNNESSTIESLRLSILNVLNSMTEFKSQKLLIIQVSIALAYLIIQDFTWETPITDVMNALANTPVNLLEFLNVLPEEMSDFKKLPLTNEEFESQFEKLLTKNAENVYYVLVQSSANIGFNKDLETLVLCCIKSWINEIPISLILSEDSPLWKLIVDGFKDDETFDTSVDCMITIVNQIDVFDNLDDNLPLIQIVYSELVALRPIIQQHWEDPMVIERLAELYASAGEAWHTLIVKDPSNFQVLIESILQLSNYSEDLDIVKYTFKFWYEMKSMLALPTFKDSKLIFKPIYIKLTEILIEHLKYPLVSDSTNVSELFNHNKENEDKFKEFRYEIGDVLKDCCLIVGQYDCLSIPFNKLQALIGSGSGVRWQEIECLLFAIRSMAKEVSKNESKIIPQIMSYLVQLPENPKIRYAATLVLGRYTLWTSAHPEFLQTELNYIIEGFKVVDSGYKEDEKMQIIIATSHALKYFCMDCSELLIDFLEPLYNLYSNIENFIDFQSLYDIVEGLSYVLQQYIGKNIVSNPDQCLSVLQMFWSSTISKLEGFIANKNDVAAIDVQIGNTVELLTLYIENFKPTHGFMTTKNPDYAICTYVMNSVLPLIFQVIERYGSMIRVSERSIKLIRKCIQTFGRFILPSLKSLENVLAQGFQNFGYGCYLWCSGALLKEFSNEEDEDLDEFIPLTTDIINEVWNFGLGQIHTFISIYEADKINVNKDLVEDFYRMLGDVLMFKPLELFSQFDIVEIVFRMSLEIIDNVNEYELLNLVIQFVIDLLSWSLENPPISIYIDIPNILKFQIFELMNKNSTEMVTKMLNYAILKFNEDLMYSSIELVIEIFKINRHYSKNAATLNSINMFLQSLPSELINDVEKMKFYNQIEVALSSKNYRKVRSSMLDFIHWYKRKIVNRD